MLKIDIRRWLIALLLALVAAGRRWPAPMSQPPPRRQPPPRIGDAQPSAW
jgi:hypothetical protein